MTVYIDKGTAITILGDDVSLLDDLLVNAMSVDHVRQQLKTLVAKFLCRVILIKTHDSESRGQEEAQQHDH